MNLDLAYISVTVGKLSGDGTGGFHVPNTTTANLTLINQVLETSIYTHPGGQTYLPDTVFNTGI